MTALDMNYADGTIKHFVLGEMTIYFNVFGAFMEAWIAGQMYGSLTITKNQCFVNNNPKI